MSNFDELNNEEIEAPEALKNMIVAEVDTLRDVMTIVNMFLGEPAKTIVTLLNELEQKK